MHLLALTLVLGPAVAFARVACRMPDTKQVYPIASALNCLRAPTLDPTIAARTQETVEALMGMNVFLDISKQPPAPYEHLAYDVEEAVAAVGKEYLGAVNSSAWDYFEDLSASFLPLKDAHTLFVKPSFFGSFTLMFPLSLEVTDNGQLAFGALPEKYSYVTESYPNVFPGTDLQSLIGKTIAKINGQDPMLWLAEWSDKNVYATKSAHGRLNSALSGDFTRRGLHVFSLPDEADQSVSFEMKDGTMALLSFVVRTSVPYANDQDAIAAYESCFDEQDAFSEPSQAKAATVRSSSPLRRFMEEQKSRKPFAHDPRASQRLLDEMAAAKSRGEADEVFTYLAGDDDFSLYSYENEDTRANRDTVFVLAVYSFSPADFSAHVYAMVDALEQVRERNATHLIVSVVSNGGGYVTLGHLLGRALFPSAYPIYGSYNIRVNDVTDALAQVDADFLRMRRTDVYSGDVITDGEEGDDMSWYLSEDKRETYSEINEGIYHGQKTIKFSSRFSFDDDNEKDIADALQAYYDFRGLDLSPDRVAIVTDGQCGSTCACFTKHLGEDKRVAMVGLGGVGGISGYAHSSEPYDVSAFAGGTVDDSDHVQDSIANLISDGVPLPEILEKIDMPGDAYMRFAFHQIFTWDVASYGMDSYTPLEYHVVPVHTVLPIFPTESDWQGITGLRKFVAPTYSLLKRREMTQGGPSCTSTELSDTLHMQAENAFLEGSTCSVSGDEHARGAYDCSGACIAYDCEPAYGKNAYTLEGILEANGSLDEWKCEQRRDPHAFDNLQDYPAPSGIHGGHIALIVVMILLVALLVYIFVEWGIGKSKAKKAAKAAKAGQNVRAASGTRDEDTPEESKNLLASEA